ncbi:MAG TPA: phosphatidylglycerophosphatase A [Nevskiaceae bacterium]|nr:phosphatidylglycerophosphatase A [Nevskiaceae bacterium]
MTLDRPRPPAPPAALILGTPEHLIAFGFGSGLAPLAPGTAGTLVAVPIWLAMLWLPLPLFLAGLVLLFAFGCWVTGESARLLGVHDHPGITFDEIVGFLIAASPLLPDGGRLPEVSAGSLALGTLAAFLLFRLFDIAKPWPIRLLDEHLGGGFGIMADDAAAGLLAAMVLAVGLGLLG